MTQTHIRNKIYFTVQLHNNAGFTDQLSRHFVLLRLGLSLGYPYCHTPFQSTRNLNVFAGGAYLFCKAGIISRVKFLKIARFLQGRDVYDFLGLSQHFASDKSCPVTPDSFPRKLRRAIELSDDLLEKERIFSYDALLRYIKRIASEEKTESLSPLLLILSGSHPMWRVISIVSNARPIDSILQSVRAAYFHQRKKHPQKSGFGEGLKILVHMRQGDRAIISTPAGVWGPILLGSPGKSKWLHGQSERDFPQVAAVEFYQFVQDLLRHLPPDIASVQIHSDGFKRIRKMLKRGLHVALSLTPPELRLVKKDLRDRQRSLVRLLRTLPDSTCFIGERKSYLYRLIHAVTEADLLITAFPYQQNLLVNVAKFYREPNSMPLIWLLQKPNAKFAKEDGSGHFEGKRARLLRMMSSGVHFVDIDAPDFPGLIEQITARYQFSRNRLPRSGP